MYRPMTARIPARLPAATLRALDQRHRHQHRGPILAYESPPAVPPYELPAEPKPGAAGAPNKEVKYGPGSAGEP